MQARKKHKEKVLRDNPDVLYADYIQLNGKRIKNNFIFHTALINAWKLNFVRNISMFLKKELAEVED